MAASTLQIDIGEDVRGIQAEKFRLLVMASLSQQPTIQPKELDMGRRID